MLTQLKLIQIVLRFILTPLVIRLFQTLLKPIHSLRTRMIIRLILNPSSLWLVNTSSISMENDLDSLNHPNPVRFCIPETSLKIRIRVKIEPGQEHVSFMN